MGILRGEDFTSCEVGNQICSRVRLRQGLNSLHKVCDNPTLAELDSTDQTSSRTMFGTCKGRRNQAGACGESDQERSETGEGAVSHRERSVEPPLRC